MTTLDEPVAMSLPAAQMPSRNIQMPREMYEIMIARMHKQEEKLKTVSDAHMMLMMRDQTIKGLQEKISLLEKSSSSSESRLANIVRQLYQQQSDKLTSLPASAQSNSSGTITLKRDVESDAVESQKENTSSGVHSSVRHGKTAHSRTIALPGISKDLFDRVVAENIRLKELLEEKSEDSGQSVEKQLDAKEYEDIIHQLRIELSQSKEQIKCLSLVGDGDQESKTIREQNTELLQKVTKMEKNLLAKQALLMSYNNEYEKLRAKNAELAAEMNRLQTMISSPPRKLTQGETDTRSDLQKSDSDTRSESSEKSGVELSSEARENELKTIEKLNEQLAKFREVNQQQGFNHEDLLKRHTAENNLYKQEIMKISSALNMERSRVQALEDKVRGLMDENSKLRDQSEIHQLQLKSNEQDFAQEKQERLQKIQQYEKSISDHQLTIRKVSSERDKMASLYQDMKSKYDEADKHLRGYLRTSPQSGLRQGLQSQPAMLMSTAGCGESVPRQHARWKANNFGGPGSIVTDCASFSPEQPPSGGSQDSSSGGEVSLSEGGVYICKRCEREFPATQKAKYQDHLKKCTDD